MLAFSGNFRLATNLESPENLEYSGISLNMENSGILCNLTDKCNRHEILQKGLIFSIFLYKALGFTRTNFS